MSKVAVRKSGGASIISLPKAIVSTLGLDVGSELELTLSDHKIILTPVAEETLEDLLAASPKSCFKVTEEDRQWLNDGPVGNEF